MQIRVADTHLIMTMLKRKIKGKDVEHEVDLGAVLREILTWANEFVPSESGSILLDDPVLKLNSDREGKLYFMACFGKGSEQLVGRSLPDRTGIIGETYHNGKPYFCEDVKKDERFYSVIDDITKFECRSIICVPIYIDKSIVGVIELINRKDRINYDEKDLALLEVFAGYTGAFIQNALDARRFEDLSKRDNLTGLHNDRYFLQRLTGEVNRVIKNGGNVALIFYDLDFLKNVNDTHGHLIGSRVLREVADITREIFADIPAVLSRYGGDEYVIILPGSDSQKAMKYAEKLRERIAQNVFLEHHKYHGGNTLHIKGVITCSVGVASLRENVSPKKNVEEMVEALIKSADSAMYRAKELGKNKVVLSDGSQN